MSRYDVAGVAADIVGLAVARQIRRNRSPVDRRITAALALLMIVWAQPRRGPVS